MRILSILLKSPKRKLQQVLSIMLITHFLTSCKNRSFDAKSLAAEYCNCMEENHASKDYYNARIICDSRMNLKNQYFKMYSIEALHGRYMGTFDNQQKIAFMNLIGLLMII